MSDSLVTIRRVYNNNVVLVGEADGTEVVLLGKGIGFARHPGDVVDATVAQRFVAEGSFRLPRVATVLSDATLDQAAVAGEVMELARTELGVQVSQAFFLPLLDHLAFAVRRAAEGVVVDFPLRWEVTHLFPDEAAFARKALALIHERLGVELQSDEWVAIALHLINHRWAGGDLSTTLVMTETIARCFDLLDRRWNRHIDRDSVSSARFVTHLRYLFVRTAADRPLAAARIDVLSSVRERYPDAAEAAVELGEVFMRHTGRTLGTDEIAYLALHTSRLFAEVESE